MKLLHISEARCHGSDRKLPISKTCPQRAECLRHHQLATDRVIGIDSADRVAVMMLPRVGALDCNYFRPAF